MTTPQSAVKVQRCPTCDMAHGGHRAACPSHPGNLAYQKLDDVYRLREEVARLRKALESIQIKCSDEMSRCDRGKWFDAGLVYVGSIAREALGAGVVADG